MIELTASVCGNSVTLTDESLKQFDGQNVTIFISEDKNVLVKKQLEAIRTFSASAWGEDAQKYVTRLRSEDNFTLKSI